MDYKHFGVMLDCSRNAVMKPCEVKRFIDCLVKLGYNTLELYTEDTYEVRGEPYFGYLRGKYTSEEIKDIDAYAKSRGVELIPCIQTLAHFTAPTKNPPLRYLWDFGDILLADEEETYAFIERCFQSVAENFSSRNINIGMDEAHMLGLGRYLEKHGYSERTPILLRHLSRVVEIAKKYGFTPHMWSDMFFRALAPGYYAKNLHLPQATIDSIPKDVELVYWDYYTYDKELYNDMWTAHEETGRNLWFAGGAWSWCGFAPYNDYTLFRMKPAMECIREHGVENVFITMWGDGGKECSYYALLPSLYAIRQYADGNFDEAKIRKGFEELFGVAFDDFMALDIPNVINPDYPLDKWPKNPVKCLLYQDCFAGIYDYDLKKEGHPCYDVYAEELAVAARRTGEYAYIFQTLADLCSVLDIKAEIGIRIREAYRANDRAALEKAACDLGEAVKRLQVFYQSFYNLWHKENKSFGWEVQDVRLGGLERRLKTCQMVLRQYLAGEISSIEELEEDILTTGEGDNLFENNYTLSVTRNNL